MTESETKMFQCRVCGADCPVAPDPPQEAVCELHCEMHDYFYDPWRRGTFCIHCDRQREVDYDE